MEILSHYNLWGVVVGAVTFLIIGLFHPLVIRGEYYAGVRIWWAFLIVGLLGVAASVSVKTPVTSILSAVFGFSSLWAVGEVFAQRRRVEKGWFPANPKREYDKNDIVKQKKTLYLCAEKIRQQLKDRQIDTVVFDWGGVLIDLDRERCLHAFYRLGFDQIEQLLDPYHPRGIFQRLEKGEISPADLYDYIRWSIRKDYPNETPPADEQIREAYLSFLDGIPVYKLRLIGALRESGIRTLALSNISPVMYEHIASRFFTADGLQVSDYFERTYLSFEMRLLKPDPEIYRRMIRESDLDPHRTLFIDDNAGNIAAARKLGFAVYPAAAHEDFSFLFSSIR